MFYEYQNFEFRHCSVVVNCMSMTQKFYSIGRYIMINLYTHNTNYIVIIVKLLLKH